LNVKDFFTLADRVLSEQNKWSERKRGGFSENRKTPKTEKYVNAHTPVIYYAMNVFSTGKYI
jgi:hypothetical protein